MRPRVIASYEKATHTPVLAVNNPGQYKASGCNIPVVTQAIAGYRFFSSCFVSRPDSRCRDRTQRSMIMPLHNAHLAQPALLLGQQQSDNVQGKQ